VRIGRQMNFKDVAKELQNGTTISIWLSKEDNKPQMAVYYHDENGNKIVPIDTKETFDVNGAVIRALMISGGSPV